MFQGLQYLYWLDAEGTLKYHIDTYPGMIHTCKVSGASAHWCYAPEYQFTSDWIVYNAQAGVQSIIEAKHVPPEVRALHLLIYRGDHA